MFSVYAYNKSTKAYQHLDIIKESESKKAIERWEEENPTKAKILKDIDKVVIVALLEPGGI